jgi:hypothetical protein
MSRRSPSKRAAARLGRPKGRAYVLEAGGNVYEVLDLPGGGRKVFALELRYVDPASPEFELVTRTIEDERSKAEARERYREAKARYDAVMATWKEGDPLPPRPVPPHVPGMKLPEAS